MRLRSYGWKCWLLLAGVAGWLALPADGAASFSEEDRSYWFFQPIVRAAPPATETGWARNEIDHFILDRLEATGLAPAPEASRRILIRRLYADLSGLPPSEAEVKAFEEDQSADAYEKLVDQLLESPRYGERWARHWLDLVRYAESDGYRADAYRPEAWRYRDYVIRSFNEDKPYDQFVTEQLAGDEIAPNDPQTLVATGYLRHWIYEHNQRDVREQWSEILADVTDVTAEVFMGMGMACARCHDHKFDPIRRKDYYQLQAFFTPILPRTDLPLATAAQIKIHEERLSEWKQTAARVLSQIEEIEKPHREVVIENLRKMFPDDIQEIWTRAPEKRSAFERQLAELAFRQIESEGGTLASKVAARIKGEERKRWEALREQLKEYETLKPERLPQAFIVTDVASKAPPTFIPGRESGEVIDPAIPAVIGSSWSFNKQSFSKTTSTGRRTALAQWLTDPTNPLTSRVMVNRIWQHHFGRGIVGTANDFGRLGEQPTHKELLDWLAAEFMSRGWSMKSMHRLIVTSATFRQSSRSKSAEGAMKDPENRLYWRMSPRRMEAEQIRDALLAVSGELTLQMGGPGVSNSEPRRSIYLRVFRNKRDPLLEAFDVPDGYRSVARRNVTVIPPQALLMMNAEWVVDRARAIAKRLQTDGASCEEDFVHAAYRRIFSRTPSSDELRIGVQFLREQRERIKLETGVAESEQEEQACSEALMDYCHVLLNANEFIYVE
jgi:hypothetical protein